MRLSDNARTGIIVPTAPPQQNCTLQEPAAVQMLGNACTEAGANYVQA